MATVQRTGTATDAVTIFTTDRQRLCRVGVGADFYGHVWVRNQVVIPVRVRVGSSLGGEDVPVPVEVQEHHWVDPLVTGSCPSRVQQEHRGSLERAADTTLVGTEFFDYLAVPVLDVAHR